MGWEGGPAVFKRYLKFLSHSSDRQPIEWGWGKEMDDPSGSCLKVLILWSHNLYLCPLTKPNDSTLPIAHVLHLSYRFNKDFPFNSALNLCYSDIIHSTYLGILIGERTHRANFWDSTNSRGLLHSICNDIKHWENKCWLQSGLSSEIDFFQVSFIIFYLLFQCPTFSLSLHTSFFTNERWRRIDNYLLTGMELSFLCYAGKMLLFLFCFS